MDESIEFRDAFDIDELKGDLEKTFTGAVVFEEWSFFLDNMFLDVLFGEQKHSFPIHQFEIIGNIYDTPEMLEGKKWNIRIERKAFIWHLYPSPSPRD